MKAALWPTLADAAQVLETRGMRFALIGGLAVSLRGQPRMTVDVGKSGTDAISGIPAIASAMAAFSVAAGW